MVARQDPLLNFADIAKRVPQMQDPFAMLSTQGVLIASWHLYDGSLCTSLIGSECAHIMRRWTSARTDRAGKAWVTDVCPLLRREVTDSLPRG